MDKSEKELINAINHYKESLLKYSRDDNLNENKLLYYIGKLHNYPVKIKHLEQTGIGLTVNGLRKLGSEVADSARSLITKWKKMVLEESTNKDNEDDDDDGDEEEEDEEQDDVVEEKHSKHKESSNHKKEHHKEDKHHKDKSSSSHKHHPEKKHSSSGSRDKDRSRDHKKDSTHSKSESGSSKRKRSTSNSSSDEYEERKTKRSRVECDSESQSEVEEKERNHKSKHKHKSEKKRPRSSDSEVEGISDTLRQDKHEKPGHKIKDSETSNRKKHGSSGESSNKHKKSDLSHEKVKEKHKEKLKPDDSNKKESSARERKSNEKRKSGSQKDNNKNTALKTQKLIDSEGINSGSGASFAEALGMLEPTTSKGMKKKISSPLRTEKAQPSSSKTKAEIMPPALLKIPQPEPLDISISSLLPPITPNYRPLGNIGDNAHQRHKANYDDEALSRVMSSKNQRTKVYSGNKSLWSYVPTLFELCTRVLQDNIDALEYTGGVPYSILKPVLEKATPNQLFQMEHHNPYLIEDTDELWQLHCGREFKNKRREELETWREMYMRCLDEREAKLIALTANIKQSQDKSLPVRQTKLAYVDSFVKPPREIARRQAKNGTKNAITPSLKLSALATAGAAGQIAVPNPGPRAAERSGGSSSALQKPKKAPLMQKALAAIKNRFRR